MPRVALILGSGLGTVVQRITQVVDCPFSEVPGLSPPTIPGHLGRVSLGYWAGQSMVVFQGRLHNYEGHTWEVVTRSVSLAKEWGASILILTNAAGGIHEELSPGSFMALRDHFEWTHPNSWKSLAVKDRPCASPYSARLLKVLSEAAHELAINIKAGLFAAVTGPNYETPAEIRALKRLGADAVGMSTVREVDAGQIQGLECLGISCITNRAAGLNSGTINHEEVLEMTKNLSEDLGRLLDRLFTKLGKSER